MSTATPEQTSVENGMQPGLRPSVTTAPKEGLEVFLERFPTEDACLDFIKEARWPNGITCCAKCELDAASQVVLRDVADGCDETTRDGETDSAGDSSHLQNCVAYTPRAAGGNGRVRTVATRAHDGPKIRNCG